MYIYIFSLYFLFLNKTLFQSIRNSKTIIIIFLYFHL